MNARHAVFISSLCLAMGSSCLLGCGEDPYVKGRASRPSLAIGIGVDRTRSFWSLQPEACELAKKLLMTLSMESKGVVRLYSVADDYRYLKGFELGRFVPKKALELLRESGQPQSGVGTDLVGFLEGTARDLRRLDKDNVGRRIILLFSDGYVDPKKSGSTVLKAYRPWSALDVRSLEGVTVRIFFASRETKEQIRSLADRTGLDIQAYEEGDMNSVKTITDAMGGVH